MSLAVNKELRQYLSADEYFDYQHPEVIGFAEQHVASDDTDVTKAIKLYLAIRDGYAYNPYQFAFEPKQFKASHCAVQTESYCIPKAILLGACARYHGIPARLGLADVKNHISSPRLLKLLGTDVFVMHGYVELFLNGQWVKATPAFDAALCERVGIHPLEFNGQDDSIFQEFNLAGHKHMEYLKDHGTFQSVPLEYIFNGVKEAYPHVNEENWSEPVIDSVFKSD